MRNKAHLHALIKFRHDVSSFFFWLLSSSVNDFIVSVCIFGRILICVYCRLLQDIFCARSDKKDDICVQERQMAASDTRRVMYKFLSIRCWSSRRDEVFNSFSRKDFFKMQPWKQTKSDTSWQEEKHIDLEKSFRIKHFFYWLEKGLHKNKSKEVKH